MLHRRRAATSASCCGPRSAEAEAAIARLTDELRLLLLPKDPNDERNVIVEIRGAEGGEEANLFARDLFEMYRAFAGPPGLDGRGAGQRPVRPGRATTRWSWRSRATACGPACTTRPAPTGCSGCR